MQNEILDPHIMLVTTKARADKAIHSLKGILLGILSDGVVKEEESVELREWVISHNELISRNPFKEFMTVIKDSMISGLPHIEVIEDLYWLTQKYESDTYYYKNVTTDLQILQGICHGILSDGHISDQEIFELDNWLQSNEHLNTHYPYDEIRSLVLSIVSDKKIEAEERLVLKAYLNQFVNIHGPEIRQHIEDGIADVHISGLCTSEPDITFIGKTFCITGILSRGNREDLQQRIRQLGGRATSSISTKTDYLVVADNGNPAWAFSCYGRKVEKAVSLRKEGHTITLVHEFDFWDAVEDGRTR